LFEEVGDSGGEGFESVADALIGSTTIAEDEGQFQSRSDVGAVFVTFQEEAVL